MRGDSVWADIKPFMKETERGDKEAFKSRGRRGKKSKACGQLSPSRLLVFILYSSSSPASIWISSSSSSLHPHPNQFTFLSPLPSTGNQMDNDDLRERGRVRIVNILNERASIIVLAGWVARVRSQCYDIAIAFPPSECVCVWRRRGETIMCVCLCAATAETKSTSSPLVFLMILIIWIIMMMTKEERELDFIFIWNPFSICLFSTITMIMIKCQSIIIIP